MKIYKGLVVLGAVTLVGSLAACDGSSTSSAGAQSDSPVSRNAAAPPAIAVPLSVLQQAGSPIISGDPAPSVLAGDAYDFLPTASDPSGNTLTFSIQNKPAWASFNIMTGEMTGTPAESDVGMYSGIVISASDSASSVALTAFSVQVMSTTGASSTTPVSASNTPASTSTSTSASTVVSTPASTPASTVASTPASTSVAVPVVAAVTPPSSAPASTPSSSGTSSNTSSTSSSTNTSNNSGSTSSSSSSSSGTTSGASAARYPRMSWENGVGNNGRADVVARSAHLDVVVLGDAYEGGAASAGYNRGTVVATMVAGDGAVVPKVQQYVLDSYFDPVNFPLAMPNWASQINAMAPYWFLYRTDISATQHATTTDPGSPWATNPVDLGAAGEDGNGNNMEAAYAKYTDNLYRTGNTADAAPQLSGPWHDNIGGVSGDTYGDYQHTGVTPGDNVTSMAAYRAGQLRFINWYRTHAPSQFVMGNVNVLTDLSDMPGVPIYQRPASVFTSLYGALDAAMVESAFGPASTEHYMGFEQMRTLVQYMESAVKSPAYNMIVHDGINFSNGTDSDLNASNGQALRYSLCATLAISSGTHAVLDTLFWFDYYAVNPSTGVALDYASSTSAQIGAARYWLGTPIDAIQTAPTQGKLYARRFRMPNGRTALVLVNPSANGGNSGAAPQTLNLTAVYGGSWTHITASNGSNAGSNPQVDNGATVTSVTVPVGDGVILIQ